MRIASFCLCCVICSLGPTRADEALARTPLTQLERTFVPGGGPAMPAELRTGSLAGGPEGETDAAADLEDDSGDEESELPLPPSWDANRPRHLAPAADPTGTGFPPSHRSPLLRC
jgi:hypothetical protein